MTWVWPSRSSTLLASMRADVQAILASQRRAEKFMSDLSDSAAKLKTDVETLISNANAAQAAAIKQAVSDALAASSADDLTVKATLDALDAEVTAFAPAPVVLPTPPAATPDPAAAAAA
jgi:hypothetical protein